MVSHAIGRLSERGEEEMPIYPYKCAACEAYQEVLLPAPPPEVILGGECPAAEDGTCTMKRVWKAPGLGPMRSSGNAGRMAK
jgi:predicted nucleic acid-binding Zn ribbon protein